MTRINQLFFNVWAYGVLPFLVLFIAFSSFIDKSINGQQQVFIILCSALIFGLHNKQLWAWYLSWLGLLALASIPLKFGMIGGAFSGLLVIWFIHNWTKLKQVFGNKSSQITIKNNYSQIAVIFTFALTSSLLLNHFINAEKSNEIALTSEDFTPVYSSIRTWVWSEQYQDVNSVLHGVDINDFVSSNTIRVTNFSDYKITNVSLGVTRGNECSINKQDYLELISCSTSLESNTTSNAVCNEDIGGADFICLVGVTYKDWIKVGPQVR